MWQRVAVASETGQGIHILLLKPGCREIENIAGTKRGRPVLGCQSPACLVYSGNASQTDCQRYPSAGFRKSISWRP